MNTPQHHHHSQSGSNPGDDVRQTHVFTQYGHYGSGAPVSAANAGGMPGMHGAHHAHAGAVAARRSGDDDDTTASGGPADLFPDMPDAKKRKFILVEDTERQTRLRVRVTLDGVDTHEIPDSFRKGSAVFPRSFFPREMQSPPPSATGSKFFPDDVADDGDDDVMETEGGGRGTRAGAAREARDLVKAPMVKGTGEVAVPRVRQSARGKEVRLNELGYRMAWLQSRVFAGRTVFLQRACKCCPTTRGPLQHGLTFGGVQWTVIGTRPKALSSPSCKTSRRWHRTTRLASASGASMSG
jgi:hypothetical protein